MSTSGNIRTEEFRDSPEARWRLKYILTGVTLYQQVDDRTFVIEDENLSPTRVTRTAWFPGPSEEVRRRIYTLAAGDVYYENEDELDNFYNENGDQISRQAAASFGLDSRPRTSYPEQVMLLPTDRHTGQTVRGGSDFPYTHSQPGARAAERASMQRRIIPDDEEQDRVTPLRGSIPVEEHSQAASQQPEGEPASVGSQCTVYIPREYQTYKVMEGSYFRLGKIFVCLWVEVKGIANQDLEIEPEGKGKGKGRTVSSDVSGRDIFEVKLRPVIVVEKHSANVTCVPIFSHGGKGVGKSGLKSEEVEKYAVVHIKGRKPQFVPAEDHWVKKKKISLGNAFTVHPANEKASLSRASRIRFDQSRSVAMNLPLLDLGTVIQPQLKQLQERFLAAYPRANAARQ